MIFTSTLFLLGLASPQSKPEVTWVKLEDGVKGAWSAIGVYPVVKGDSALLQYFNAQLKRAVESRFYEAAYNLRKGSSPVGEYTAKAILSIAGDRIASALVTVTKPGSPVELYPVTCWLSGKQALNCTWGSLVKAGTSADSFADTLVLPPLNELRKSSGLAPLSEFPAGLLDTFVVTQSNVCWIAPPGLAAKYALQIKVPISEVNNWTGPDSPLGKTVPLAPGPGAVPMRVVVSWPSREPVPSGSVLEFRLLRDRDDPTPLAVLKTPAKDPPMEVNSGFSGIKVDPDERLYLDIRVVNGGQTLFRNRTTVRIPAQGWQTIHEIALDKER